jgi:anti-anti-sigma regulatory factor
MNFRKRESAGGLCIELEGPLCIHSTRHLWESIQSDEADSRPLILDLSAVTECDAAGVQMVYALVSYERCSGRHVTVMDNGGIATRHIESAGLSMRWSLQKGEGCNHA